MGLFKEPKKVKDFSYFLGASLAAYGLYLINNWSKDEKKIAQYGGIFSSVAKHYDTSMQTEYFSQLFAIGTMSREFPATYTSDEVRNILQSRTKELNKLKELIATYNVDKSTQGEILRLLYDFAKVDPDGKDAEEKQHLEFWLVQCVFNTVLDSADLKRAFSERDDGPIESMVNGLVGAVALGCLGEYSERT